MSRLDGAVAVVTGGSSGIGAAIATLFAHEGATVGIVAHAVDAAAQKLVSGIEQAGGRAIAVAADVGDEQAVATAFAKITELFGPATILVNSAGVDASGIPVADMPLAQFEAVLRTNLVGPFLCAKAFLGGLPKGTQGKIVNISSVHEELAFPNFAAYCASKGGIRMLTRTLAVELGPLGITINSIAPGAIETPINTALLNDKSKLESLLGQIPLGRLGTTGDVAGLAVFLASADSDYITGATYTIDGGLGVYYQEQ